jgi:DNA repair protein RecO (recombination protein O)
MTSRLYRDRGIVLRTYKSGEADRIVVFLTENNGKVRSIAKGVRKTRSKFGGRLEPLSLLDVQFHRGRDLDIVNQVETVDSTHNVFGDLDSMTEAIAVLEAVDQLVPDREPVPHLYRMLVGARRTLLTRPSPLVVPAFLWKLLASEGVHPVLDRCSLCDETPEAGSEFGTFDVRHGGVTCSACRAGIPVSRAALDLMREVLGGGLGEALDRAFHPEGQTLDDPVINEVSALATKAFEHHVERRLRSVSIFERHDPGS